MASIGTHLHAALPHATQANNSGPSASGSGASSNSNSLATQQTFLQLLVAQLKNQDPTQPVEGTQFVTQLATFSDVEQNLAMRQDMDAISNKFLGDVPSGGTVAGTTGTSSTSGS